MGRQLVSDYQIALSYALRDRNPKYVVRYVIGLNKVITIQYLDMARKVFGFFWKIGTVLSKPLISVNVSTIAAGLFYRELSWIYDP